MARLIVLARLLTPHDFGLMAVALTAMALMRQFSETGFKQALIQRPGEVRSYLGTAWTVIFLRNMVLAGVMVATAPLVASFFDAPEAKALLQVLAISWVISGLRNVGMVLLHKELAFGRFAAFHLTLAIVELAVSVSLALVFRSVWALVYGYLASSMVGLVLSYVVAPRPERIALDLRKARELFIFGRWILGSNVIGFLLMQLDKIVIGKVAGVTALGLYQLAFNISSMAGRELQRVIAQTTLPAYSKLQDRTQDLKNAYLKVVQISSLAVMPATVGMVLLADGLVHNVLGEQWLAIIGTMQILAIWSATHGLARTATSLFAGMGKPDISTKTMAIRLLILAALIYPFVSWWGMPGAAIALVVSSATVDPLVWYLAARLVGARIGDLAKALAPATVGSLAMIITVLTLDGTLLSQRELPGFVALVLLAGVAYLAGLSLSAVALRWNPKDLLVLNPASGQPGA